MWWWWAHFSPNQEIILYYFLVITKYSHLHSNYICLHQSMIASDESLYFSKLA